MKPGLQTGRITGAAAAVAVVSGCFGLTITGTTYNGRGTGASSSQTSTASGGNSGGIGASSSGSGIGGTSPSSGGVSSGGGTSSGGAGSTTGSTSGGSSTGFADGGYVFCTVPGLPTWLCTPGTYFCDPSDAGVCFQCLSDADCADQGRPTYDPKRPRCDLHSGVPGYQSFCQVCVSDADCASNPNGPLCDISPNYPPAPIYQGPSRYGYSSTEPPIVDLGFETCGILQTDCRVDGGPICRDTENQRCEPDSGLCVYPSDQCSTDADCTGLFDGDSFPLEPEPYCVMGYCTSCLNSNCQGRCLSDLDCSGVWPRCTLLDAGFTDDAGLPLGFCGCDTDDQCGDAGWICTEGFCGVPCTAPNVPACGSVSSPRNNAGAAFDPICNPSTGLCEPCISDQQCQADPASGGPTCTDGGRCGCVSNSDCPAGQTCQAPPPDEEPYGPAQQAICVPSLSRCTPGSCGQDGRVFCDWRTGECLDAGPSFPYDDKACLTDYDCAAPPDVLYAGLFCDPVAHVCTTCNTSADCAGLPSSNGSHCFQEDAGVSSCGCLSDADCSGNPAGPVCDTTASDQTFHSCGCRTPQDCQIDQTCPISTGATFSACSTFCTADSDCQPGYACDPGLVCRAHCEGQPCPASEPVCDSQGGVGQNGQTAAGPVPYIVWCYGCLEASECSFSECDSKTHTCGPCQRNIDCPAGEVCHSNQCLATCDAVPCPAGRVCDTNNLVGAGPDLCYECVSPIDCPNGEGCSSRTQTCGRCEGPNAYGQPYFDCPPGAVCSSYWSGGDGVCLAGCDLSSCPADQPICAVLPALTPDHKYCFGCLQDSDCVSFGAGAWCDVSVGLTFSCQVAH